MDNSIIDNDSQKEIMTTEEVARYLKKSPSWVYKNWKVLGGVKLMGSLFFPKKEKLYEHLFSKRQELEVRLQLQRTGSSKAGFKTKRQAKEAEAEKRQELKKPQPEIQTPTDITFLDLVNIRLDYLKAYKVATYYQDHIYMVRKLIVRWEKVLCKQITPLMVQNYLIERSKYGIVAANISTYGILRPYLIME